MSVLATFSGFLVVVLFLAAVLFLLADGTLAVITMGITGIIVAGIVFVALTWGMRP